MHNRLFFLLKYFLYSIVNFFYFKKTYLKDSIVIIKLDGIGDYILLRNFLTEVKKDKIYKDFNITLVANFAFKDLCEILEKKIINNFIWIDKHKFLYNFLYRIKILKDLNNFSYSILLNPTFSRDFFISDWISNFIDAKKKISFRGDCSNQPDYAKKISNNYYNSLIEYKKINDFEFFKYKFFFELFLNKKILLNKPEIKIIQKTLKLPKKYACLFVDAGEYRRIYNLKKYLIIAKNLENFFGKSLFFLGQDLKINNDIIETNGYINMIGKTNLLQTTEIIKNSCFLITNDTCASHIAAAVKTNCLVIYSGIHLGRFLPYPEKVFKKHLTFFHSKIFKNLEKYEKQSNESNNYRYNINSINHHEIIKFINSKFNFK